MNRCWYCDDPIDVDEAAESDANIHVSCLSELEVAPDLMMDWPEREEPGYRLL